MKVYKIKVNGKSYKVELEAIDEVQTEVKKEEVKKDAPAPKKEISGDGQKVLSPIQGTVTNIKVKVGDKVKKGDVLLIIEAMKLENDVPSPFDGVVSDILVNKGQNVAAKDPVIIVK